MATKPLVLVGMMGVGKTSAGILLAARRSLPFHDSDEEVEDASGLSIGAIFSAFGESFFRDLEYRTIAKLVEMEPDCILSVGGGAFIQLRTRTLLLEKTDTLWLDMEESALVQRLSSEPDTRPLLAGQDIAARVRTLLQERRPCYALARYRLDVTGLSLKDVVAGIEAITGKTTSC